MDSPIFAILKLMEKSGLKIFNRCLLAALFSILTLLVQGQMADEELAAQYLANKEYSKASDMYEKLLNKNPKSFYFYDNLFKCYTAQKDFTSAQKLCKKQSKRFESQYFYQVDQGYIYRLQQEDQKAIKLFNALIDEMKPQESEVYSLAKAFEKRDERAFSVQTYLRGRKIVRSELIFASELGGLYSEIGDNKLMVEEYLNVLVIDESSISEVQGFLQNKLETKEDFDWLKQSLNKKNKQYPERSVFNEMLIWYHVQKNEYELAIVYAKTLDRKFKEEGRRIMDLGFLAMANEKYDAAIQIFRQVAMLGNDKPYYSFAKSSELEARSKKILQGNYTSEDLKVLVGEYQNVLNELGENPGTAATISRLANLEAYYLNDYPKAIKHYEQIIAMPRIDRNLQANCKLDLADFYVMKGEVWEAMLLYGQVDKDFLQEPLGQEAKYRNARLSYYLGEFEWAKAQLDVLKTATTQLIANNALELSLLIQDNSVDSNLEPLHLYAKADLNYVQKNYRLAFSILDSLDSLYPKHALADDILFKRAQIYMDIKDFNQAAKYFEMVVQNFGSDILGDNSLYQLARLNQFQLNRPAEALKFYEKFLDAYPGSFFLTDTRKQFRLLRGDQLN
ncbi:MAG: tetratricopeptide repeat protein [bacterium]|nr:tetratricopeptide repeat protein [bacterium]